MVEERIFFRAGTEELEGILEMNSREMGIVITHPHPHPLYGGDMDNAVVESIARPCRAKGYSILKFNFRGVGKSGGRHENGVGEQGDVQAAIACLQAAEVQTVMLAGYSFGAFVNIGAVRNGAPVEKLILVSPPVGMMDLGEPDPLPCLKLVVTGSRDEIAPASLLGTLIPRWNHEAHLEVIEGADHFYSGFLKPLVSVLSSYV